jgi:hypothetical protein
MLSKFGGFFQNWAEFTLGKKKSSKMFPILFFPKARKFVGKKKLAK